MKNIKIQVYKTSFITIVSLIILSSCENNFENEQNLETSNNFATKLDLIEGTIKIENKTILKRIFKDYKKDTEQQNNFNNEIRKMQNKGFKPLTPIFDENDTEKIENFFLTKKQRLQKRNIEFGITAKSAVSDDEIDFDDELISDPALAGLLNESKEIYVADSLYKYTETGLYFCLIKDKQKLYNYLDKLSATSKKKQITNRLAPCDEQYPQLEKGSSTNKIIQEVTEVSEGINLFIPITDCNSGGGGSTPTPTPVLTSPTLIKQNLPICRIEKQGWLEKIFGETEVDTEDYGDGKRVKVKFWNQNYFLFSSIGCSARFQKRVKILGISGWQKSYATQIELGINNIEYTYNFNVPQFNASKYQYSTVFFESNGLKFNQEGRVIDKMPTGKSSFIFDSESPQDALNITICNDILTLLNAKEANMIIDNLAKAAVNALPGMADKYLLQNKIANGKIKYNVIIATPLDNKVTFKVMGVKWTNNDDNAITNYFDFNFLITWDSTYENPEDYLKGLKGAKKYNALSADIYGAALHDNVWKGRRLVLEK